MPEIGVEVGTDAEEDVESWLREATPDEVRVPICMKRSLLSEFDALVAEYESINRPRAAGLMMDLEPVDPRVEELQRRVIAVKQAIDDDEKKHTYIIRKLPYSEWRALLQKYPPTKEQTERYRGLIDHDIDVAAPALVAASCARPHMTEEQAKRLRSALPENVWGRLYNAAMQVNRTGTELPLSARLTVDQLASDLKSTSLASMDSPSPSSTDESLVMENLSGPSTT